MKEKTVPAQEEPGALRRSFADKRWATAIVCVLLGLATAVTYLPVVQNEFVNYDDPDYVTSNAHVQGGLRWGNIEWAFTTGHASNWHPLTWLSHIVDWQVFGDRPAAHHLVNVGFHIANGLLLFVVLRRLTGEQWRSAVVAALFALHPLHVESVAWISERKDVLSALFFLLTLGCYAVYVERSRLSDLPTGQPGRGATGKGYYVLALLCFGLGLMSKPMLVTVPFVLLLLDYWPLKRIEFTCRLELQPTTKSTEPREARATAKAAAEGVERRGVSLLNIILEKVPFLVLSLVSSIITFRVQRAGGAVSTSLSLGGRIANALVSYVRYIGNTLWPAKLSVLYPHPGHWPPQQVVGASLLLLVLFALVIVCWRRYPYVAVGWFWFCGMLVPAIGLVQVGVQSMADRYTYLPLIGLFIVFVWGLAEILPQRRGRNWAFGAAAAVALAACAWLAHFQIQIWRTSETLFRRATQVTQGNYLAYNNLGFYLSKDGKIDEAMVNYRESLKINPAYEDALNNMGYALAAKKHYPEAIAYYDAALRIRPKHAEVHNNLGNALSECGRIEEAIQHYRITLEQVPEHADAHNNLGIALAMQGKFDEAIQHFHEAIRYKPNYASAHSNLGNALAVQHKLEEAIKEYEESLRLKSDDAQAHNNLGNALAEKGLLDQAIEHYTKALKLNADNPEAHFNVGMALARQGKANEARSHYEQALRLKPDYAEARSQLNSLPAPKP